MAGQPDIMIMNYHNHYTGCCIENLPQINTRYLKRKKKIKHKYKQNNYYFILSNDYDLITRCIKDYMEEIRVPCKYCSKKFLSKETHKTHLKIIHRREQ